MSKNTAADVRYRRKNNDTITITLPKGERELWKAAAQDCELSLNAMIRQAVRTLYVDDYCNVAGIVPDYQIVDGAIII